METGSAEPKNQIQGLLQYIGKLNMYYVDVILILKDKDNCEKKNNFKKNQI